MTIGKHLMNVARLCLLIVPGIFLVVESYNAARAQGSIAVIPLFHDRWHQSEGDNTLELTRQRVIVFVYRNAAAVYMDATFVNTESDSITHELALPSAGHTSIRSGTRSNGMIGVRLWVGGERVEPAIAEGKETWYTIAAAFGSHEEKKVRALFWVQTSLAEVDGNPGRDTMKIADGRRAFIIDMQHASAWKNNIQSVDISVTLRESLTRMNSSMGIEPKNYFDQNSGFFWSLQNIEPSFADDISVLYTPPRTMASHWNSMAKLSEFITTIAYGELLAYVKQLDEE